MTPFDASHWRPETPAERMARLFPRKPVTNGVHSAMATFHHQAPVVQASAAASDISGPADTSIDEENAAASEAERPEWPKPMSEAALHGIAGEFVRMVEPNTEADPAALLIHFLVCFGAYVGRRGSGPHFRIERDKHHANLYAVVVGESSKARKGTALGRVRDVLNRIPDWKPEVKGLSTGEGLIHAVRDAREATTTNDRGEQVTGIVDAGVSDKRLLVIEPEFARVLKAADRPGNILSTIIRDGWDSGDFRTLTKSEPASATNAHVCIIGHITATELRAELAATETANGFANRFLFVAAKRSKLLPLGADDADEAEVQALGRRLHERIETARTRSRITMTADAEAAWCKVYEALSTNGDGLHGAITGRAEAQTIRLALCYCLLDGADRIDLPHLLAALAVWEYCDATVRYVFGASLGDRIADDLLRRLRKASDAGLTRTDIRDALGKHQSTDRISAALTLLRVRRLATCEMAGAGSAGGRPTELWRATK